MGFLGDLVQWFFENASELCDANDICTAGWLERTWEHVQVSAVSVLVAMVIAIPLASWLGHTGRGGLLAVSVVNIGRALPSFGIVALALPITIRIARNTPFVESGLGFFPTFVALVALALPPIFTNTYTGIRSVDPDTVEAARGMGVNGPGILLGIELPMASPVILAGVRTSAVQVVATATLGALVAYGGYGRFIIDGFALRDDLQIVAGAVLVALLSVATEGLFALLERWLVPSPLRIAARGPSEVAGARAV